MAIDRRRLLQGELLPLWPERSRGRPELQIMAQMQSAPHDSCRCIAERQRRLHHSHRRPGWSSWRPIASFPPRLYNGQFPGPLLRLKEGQRVVVDIHNDTDTPEQLHWHGQIVPVDVDGAAEEGTPFIPAHGMRRIAFTPGPAGLRFYHTHLVRRRRSDARAVQRPGRPGVHRAEARAGRATIAKCS